MDKKKQISDELLAKYMSGKISSEEEKLVLDYLADNDENLNDFLNMASAIELHHKENNRHKNIWQRVLWVSSAAAAIAIVVIIGVFVFHNKAEVTGNQFAQEVPEQTILVKDSSVIIDLTDTQYDESLPAEEIGKNGKIPSLQKPKLYADSAKKKNYANMVFPASKLISVSDNKKSINFRWITDAVNVYLSVKTQDNKIIMEKDLGTVKYCNLPLTGGTDTLHWQLLFTYSDGNTITKNGKIALVKTE